ncbi:hypothetical protein [Bosea sp. NBC_00550]|uniref:hypothetical protein n=1 Tax=Bosea sp. NBC_00550 TaxID=2969621 RepID=UPI00222FE789|nr:hypothetical protein [Bosea sp. NBC_00550]UZF91934.1 hypothetical protein NWE53_23010 [Bosea sp. NBC_00550]
MSVSIPVATSIPPSRASGKAPLVGAAMHSNRSRPAIVPLATNANAARAEVPSEFADVLDMRQKILLPLSKIAELSPDE